MNNLAIIIVNWNGRKFLKDCLDSLESQTYKDFNVILVDNGSKDDSVSFVRKNYPHIEIITLSENTGFAKGNNIGISKALENREIENIITLNNDTKVSADFVEKMVECAKNYPDFASIQPKVLDAEGKIIDCVGVLVYNEMSAQNKGYGEEDNGQYEKSEEIFGVSACAALYSRKALGTTKLPGNNYFDEDYFAYYEDVDLAWRMRLSGFKSYYCPEAEVFHIHSATGAKFSPFKKFYLHRNQYYNIIKNLPFRMMVKAILFMPVRYFLIIHSILVRKGSAAKTYEKSGKSASIGKIIFKGWKEIIQNLPSLIKKRKIIQGNKAVKNSEIKKWMKEYKSDFKKIIYG